MKNSKKKDDSEYDFKVTPEMLRKRGPLNMRDFELMQSEIDRVDQILEEHTDIDDDVMTNLDNYLKAIEDRLAESIDSTEKQDKRKHLSLVSELLAAVKIKYTDAPPIPLVKTMLQEKLAEVPDNFTIRFEDVKKTYPDIAEKIKKFFFTKGGKITVADLKKKLQEDHKDKQFWLSEKEWTYTQLQRKMPRQAQVVIQLNFTPDMITELKKSEPTFKFMSMRASSQDGNIHPLHNRTFAWARVYKDVQARLKSADDETGKVWIIEEIQSDYIGWESGFKSMGKTMRDTLDKKFTEGQQKEIMQFMVKHFHGWEKKFLATLMQMARKEGAQELWIFDEVMKTDQSTTPSKLEWFYKKIPKDLGFNQEKIDTENEKWTVWRKSLARFEDKMGGKYEIRYREQVLSSWEAKVANTYEIEEQNADNFKGEDCENYDDGRDVCLDDEDGE